MKTGKGQSKETKEQDTVGGGRTVRWGKGREHILRERESDIERERERERINQCIT